MQTFWTFLFILSLVILIHQYFVEPKSIKNKRINLSERVKCLLEVLNSYGSIIIEDVNNNHFTYKQLLNASSISVIEGKLLEIISELSYENYHTNRSLSYIETKLDLISNSIAGIRESIILDPSSNMSVESIVPRYKTFYGSARNRVFNDSISKIERFCNNLNVKFKRRD